MYLLRLNCEEIWGKKSSWIIRLICEIIGLFEIVRKILMKWSWIVKIEICLLYSFFDYWIEFVE